MRRAVFRSCHMIAPAAQNGSMDACLHFDNAFLRELPGDAEAGPRLRQVHGALWSQVRPEPVAAPRLLAHSRELAAVLGFSQADVASAEFARVFGGNALLPGMPPFAANYGGHQLDRKSTRLNSSH